MKTAGDAACTAKAPNPTKSSPPKKAPSNALNNSECFIINVKDLYFVRRRSLKFLALIWGSAEGFPSPLLFLGSDFYRKWMRDTEPWRKLSLRILRCLR